MELALAALGWMRASSSLLVELVGKRHENLRSLVHRDDPWFWPIVLA